MKMRDSKFIELEEGQKVRFILKFDHWDGEVAEVNNNDEQISIKVIGTNSVKRFNYLECERYITIL